MKRPLIAIFAVIYFAVSSGVVMNIHYCMGKQLSAKLDILGGKTCGCGKSEKKGCCKTEFKVIKIEDVQKATYTDYAVQAPVAIVSNQWNLLQASRYNSPAAIRPVGHSPPLLSAQDTYLQNGVFRI